MPMTPTFSPSTARLFVRGMAPAIIACLCGCFAEQSIPLTPRDVTRLEHAPRPAVSGHSTREWLERAHVRLAGLIPATPYAALVTDELTRPDGEPRDVLKHFAVRPDDLPRLLPNFSGLRCTAQGGSTRYFIDRPAPPWRGFDDVWIPVRPNLSLCGRIGWARDKHGRVTVANAIVILPGLFGDHGVARTRDLAMGLRACGYHVLSLEPRAHGQTEARYPQAACTFGVLETDELMAVNDWLESQPGVSRTGLIGFCWGATTALLAAWYDGRAADDPAISPGLSRFLLSVPRERPRFEAGIIAFSPILRWEELRDRTERPRSIFFDPPTWAVQQTVRDRMRRKGYTPPDGDLGRLIEFEYQRCDLTQWVRKEEGFDFVRLLPYRALPVGDKLEAARTPMLVVHASNDPLSSAQDVAHLMSRVSNPRVAALIVADGGHVGFAVHAPRHYFSLIVNYFDEQSGAAAFERSVAAIEPPDESHSMHAGAME